MDFKKIKTTNTTITRNTHDFEDTTGNIYEAIVAVGKRSGQLNDTIKEELKQKLSEFASHTDNLEEVFENREQIEISKYYESLPKPTLLAIQELLDGELYIKYPVND
jgi:DNA-directed RNA polymerase subunit K/omega